MAVHKNKKQCLCYMPGLTMEHTQSSFSSAMSVATTYSCHTYTGTLGNVCRTPGHTRGHLGMSVAHQAIHGDTWECLSHTRPYTGTLGNVCHTSGHTRGHLGMSVTHQTIHGDTWECLSHIRPYTGTLGNVCYTPGHTRGHLRMFVTRQTIHGDT